jgi:undecaprenyl-diphosphatase
VSPLLIAAILGVVQGITEFLPVSSSAHLLLGRHAFGWVDPQTGLVFDVATHLGTLVATIIYFRDDLLGMAGALPRILTGAPEARLLRLVVIGTVPIVIVGLLFAKWIEAHARIPIVTVVTLSAGAIGLLLVERLGPRTRGVEDLTPGDGAAFGLAQAAALIPGISRSGSTLTVGMLMGVRREAAARFTFLMGIPAVVAALAKESLELRHLHVTADLAMLLAVGAVVSGIVGYLAIRFLIRYLVGHRLDVFAYYRLALAAVVWWFVH